MPRDGDLRTPHRLPLANAQRLVDAHRSTTSSSGDHALLDAVQAWLADAYAALEPDRFVLAHGDLHLENVLWHQGTVSALLDLEASRPTWREVDLELLFAYCEAPARFVYAAEASQTLAEDYHDVPDQVRVRRPDWIGELTERRLHLLRLVRCLAAERSRAAESYPSSWTQRSIWAAAMAQSASSIKSCAAPSTMTAVVP